ncbi:MAG: peptidylprolyl isomerase [Bryobacteraceae bacterium]
MTALEINGEIVERERFRREAALLRQESGSAGSLEEEMQLAAKAERIVIDHVLLDQEARRLGLTVGEMEIAETLTALTPRSDGVAGCRAGVAAGEIRTEVERRLRMDRLLERWFASLRPPRLEDVRKYYRRNRESFLSPEMVRVFQIVKNLAEGEDPAPVAELLARVRQSLLAGADFAEMAHQFSDCPERGGDLGYFPRGVMVEEFDAVVFSAPVGELSGVFRTRFGVHIVLVQEHRDEGVRSFEEARPEIESAMLGVAQDRELGARLAELRARAVIRKVSLAS